MERELQVMDVYAARQPIFNIKKKIFAYELLFRDGLSNFMTEKNGDMATRTLLSHTFFSIGLDSISNGKRSFINFTENLLLDRVPFLLPKKSVVVEILENVAPKREVVSVCRELSKKGYLLALDDFEFHSELMPLIALANIIKFDFLLTPVDVMEAYIRRLPSTRKVVLLAEKVETNEAFRVAVEMGFELFQGFFFCKPEIIKDKEISANQIHMLQIIAEAHQSDISFDKVEVILEKDVAITYKLLRYINSAFFAKRHAISSIKQALVYMGEKELRRFVSLAAMASLAKDKPNELMRMVCIRGKFCELLGSVTKENIIASELFTLGMFSLIDAVVNLSMEEIMQRLPLSPTITDAIMNQTGLLANYLLLTKAYERAEWERVGELCGLMGIDEIVLPSLYLEACKWSYQLN